MPRMTKTARLALLLAAPVVSLSVACGAPPKPAVDPDLSVAPAPATDGSMTEVASGKAALTAKKYEDARSYFAAALTKKPSDLEANYYLALTYEQLGSPKDAETYYKKTLELKPDDAGAAENLSAIYLDQDRVDEAVALCTSAVAKSPKEDKLHFCLARGHAAKHDVTSATDEFKKTIALSPDNADFHFSYASWLAILSQQDATKVAAATGEAKQALSLAKEDSDLLLRIGQLFVKLKDATDCIGALDRAIARGESAEARTTRGMCKMSSKDPLGAEQDFRAAITADAKFVKAYFWLGNLLHSLKRDDEAIAALQSCQKLDPDGAGKAADKLIAAIKAGGH